MLFGQNRDQLRRFYVEVWRKFQKGEPLQPLEAMIAEVVALHPEYHALLQDEEKVLTQEFSADSGQGNPFMHMGMHIGLREQVSTDRPPGIKAIHSALTLKTGDTHEAEHRMIECLGQAMWEAQQNGMPPDESRYLECLRRL
jgi:hypothetical protein